MTPTLERSALKEWAVLCDAMAGGEIIALVRKGGIREQRAGFSVRHDRFLLFPTSFHEKAGELAPRFAGALAAPRCDHTADGMVRLELVATVAAVWVVEDLERVRAIGQEHGLAWPAVSSRFHYKRPGLTVVAVEVSRLPEAVTVPNLPRYAGCVSWVTLEEGVAVEHGARAIAPADFETRLRRIHDALGSPVTDAPGS